MIKGWMFVGFGIIVFAFILLFSLPGLAKPQPDAAMAGPTQPVKVEAPKAAKVIKVPKATIEVKPDVEKQKWWQSLLVFFIKLLDLILEPILIAFGYVFTRKFGFKVERETLEWIVDKATGFAEQKAKAALKAGSPMAGPDILKLALEQGNQYLVEKGLMKKWGNRLGDLIESKLGEVELKKKLTTPPPKS